MKPFRILDEALVELDAATTWYEEQQTGLGQALIADLRERLETALKAPGAGSPAGETSSSCQIRRFRLTRFKRYAVLIATIRGEPTVVAFEHSSRRPGYWRERLM